MRKQKEIGFHRKVTAVRKTTVIRLCIAIAMIGLCGCTGRNYNVGALHINYTAEENYGSDDYLGTMLTIGGKGMSQEVQYTVKELEDLAMAEKSLQYQGEYSMMSRGGEFFAHEFTGIRLYELLKKAGLNENLSSDTDVRFVSVDGAFMVMKLGEIIESTDCTFKAKTDNKPLEINVPKILAFGSDGVPLVGPVGSIKLGEVITENQGYDAKAQNDGGPIRLIFGQQTADDSNAPNNVKWLRQIIVGVDDNQQAHSAVLAAEQVLRSNDMVTVDIGKGQWNHRKEPYSQYLNSELKISGSEAKAITYTLRNLEDMADSTVADTFGASCGVFGFQGVRLKDIVISNLADGVTEPSRITVIAEDGLETEISVNDMMNGIDSRYQNGEHRDIIIAYAVDGSPLVRDKKSEGFTGNNGSGPMKLIVENKTTLWVRSVNEVIIGNKEGK